MYDPIIPTPKKPYHPGSENLIPPKKGEVRNPTGRNQYTWLKELGMQVLEEKLEHGGKKKEFLQLMLEKLRNEFLDKGNVAAAKELFDRIFGKAHQSVDITTNNESINKVTYNLEGKDPEELRKIKALLQNGKVNGNAD